MTAFEEMGVLSEIAQAVEDMDWTLPTDIQAEAIPMILGGGDVLMAAETGSGKTGAFCLPILQTVCETLKDIQEGKGGSRSVSRPATSSTWMMSLFDRTEAFAVDSEGLLCQSRDPQGWHGGRSNKGVKGKGKYYFEATITDEGLCRVGWSTENAKLDLGTDHCGFGFGGTGKKSNNKQFDSYGESFGLKDTIGCFLDLDSHTIKWSKNGFDFGKAYDIPGNLRNSVFYAAVCLKNAEIKFNFGATPLSYSPVGYTALSTASSDCVVNSKVSGSSGVSAKVKLNIPYAVIMEPSRELAEQTLVQIQKFKKHLSGVNVRELLVVGGASAKDQIDALTRGVDIVVGTPGRLDDLISTGKLELSSVRFFVLDECDGLLSAGYGELISRIYKQIPQVTPDGKRLQMVVCSATLHSFEVKKLAEKLMHFPTWIDLKGQDSVPETVHHVVLNVDPRTDQSWKNLKKHIKTDGVHSKDRLNHTIETAEMMSEAVKILKGEYCVRAINEHKMDRAIIFCRTKVDCDNLEDYLNQVGGGRGATNPYSCVCLHSDRKPAERKENLEKFKAQKVKFMICTDVAARGIDVSGLPYVINVTLPDEKQNYVHRIGRVGRADRMGLAISFAATVKEKVWYHSNCASKGKNCNDTRLTTEGGCCIWYNEPAYVGDIEEHLGVTIDQVDTSLKVAADEFDGKVVYGQKRSNTGGGYKGHVEALAPAVKQLAELEKTAQSSYLNLYFMKPFTTGRK